MICAFPPCSFPPLCFPEIPNMSAEAAGPMTTPDCEALATRLSARAAFRGQRLHTRNQHLRNHIMGVQWQFATSFCCSAVVSKGLSRFQWICTVICLWIFIGIFQWNFTFVTSDVTCNLLPRALERETRSVTPACATGTDAAKIPPRKRPKMTPGIVGENAMMSDATSIKSMC